MFTVKFLKNHSEIIFVIFTFHKINTGIYRTFFYILLKLYFEFCFGNLKFDIHFFENQFNLIKNYVFINRTLYRDKIHSSIKRNKLSWWKVYPILINTSVWLQGGLLDNSFRLVCFFGFEQSSFLFLFFKFVLFSFFKVNWYLINRHSLTLS